MKSLALLFATLLGMLAPAIAAEKIRVSSFSTILTEIAEQVGGDRVAVTGHVKRGVDPHTFEPKPSDLKILGEAQLVLLSAKNLENYVGKLREATGSKHALVEVGNGFASLQAKAENDPGRAVEDPHWWHSIGNVVKATRIVRDALIKADPADKSVFAANAAKHFARLAALEQWARDKVAELPRDQRKLVTSHDAFQYFARDFGFTIYAIEGVSAEDQPSSKKVAELIAAIKAQGVKAIFLESVENPKVLKTITNETGIKVGGSLYADGLGEGDASTYEGMYKHNVTTIVDALK
jgi:ABC-type Zn uptake system ZnuABC Zn-binding protein ZnuA